MGRRERQKEQIGAALESGAYARVLVLAREHLAEFPRDHAVKVAAAHARRAWAGEDAAD